MKWNPGQEKPNGCHTGEAFKYCMDQGYVKKIGYCGHPDLDYTINFVTQEICRPCHPKAAHRHDSGWVFGGG